MQIHKYSIFERLPHNEDVLMCGICSISIEREPSLVHEHIEKPWGFEYPLFRNQSYDVWELYLHPYSSTSSHVHIEKEVFVFVIEGTILLKMRDAEETIFAGEMRILKKRTLHQFINTLNTPARVLEIESPPNRDDILRINDTYGRAGMTYTEGGTPNGTLLLGKRFLNSFLIHETSQHEIHGFLPASATPEELPEVRVCGVIAKEQKLFLKNTSYMFSFFGNNQETDPQSLFVLDGTLTITETGMGPFEISSGDCYIFTNETHGIRAEKDTSFLLL